jgi:HSP20 family protein
MKVTDLIPWKNKREVPVRREDASGIFAIQTALNRAFDSFWRDFDLPAPDAWGNGSTTAALPRVDMRENGSEVEVVAELPGMDESNVVVSVAEGVLTIRGEKQSESEKEEKGYVLRERIFGSFERVVPLPAGLDLDAVKAVFKNGVLTVTLPKTAEAREAVKRVAVRRA